MRANRGVDTAPELLLRRYLYARGFRYRVHLRMKLGDIAVRPDIVFTRQRVAVFVDGCFWHGCELHASWPKSNAEFWRAKIEGNRRRDRSQDAALRGAGWTVVRVWEHDDIEEAAARIEHAVEGQRAQHLPRQRSVLDAGFADEGVELRHHHEH